MASTPLTLSALVFGVAMLGLGLALGYSISPMEKCDTALSILDACKARLADVMANYSCVAYQVQYDYLQNQLPSLNLSFKNSSELK